MLNNFYEKYDENKNFQFLNLEIVKITTTITKESQIL